jgi:hypothetical protein
MSHTQKKPMKIGFMVKPVVFEWLFWEGGTAKSKANKMFTLVKYSRTKQWENVCSKNRNHSGDWENLQEQTRQNNQSHKHFRFRFSALLRFVNLEKRMKSRSCHSNRRKQKEKIFLNIYVKKKFFFRTPYSNSLNSVHALLFSWPHWQRLFNCLAECGLTVSTWWYMRDLHILKNKLNCS